MGLAFLLRKRQNIGAGRLMAKATESLPPWFTRASSSKGGHEAAKFLGDAEDPPLECVVLRGAHFLY